MTILTKLTPAQRKVAVHLSKGLCNKDIARQLGRSAETVKYHVNLIIKILEVRNRAQAALTLAEAFRAEVPSGPVEVVVRVLAVDEYSDRHCIDPEREKIEGTDHFERWLALARPSLERASVKVLAALAETKELCGHEQ